jgi:hypothetical protein
MGERWRELLARLKIKDDDLLKHIQRACWAQPRFRQVGVTRDLVDSVCASVFLAIVKRLVSEPDLPIFHDADQFKSYVWAVARNSDDPDARRLRPRRVREIVCSPDDLSGVKGRPDADARDLDCPRLCDNYLRDAAAEHREVFLAVCEGVRRTGDSPTYAELATQFDTSRATICRRWGVAAAIIRRKSGKDHTDLLDGD